MALNILVLSRQVDEQSVIRHQGERKVRTVEEDMEEVTSGAAELLDEGEELIGGRTMTSFDLFVKEQCSCAEATCAASLGDDSSNEDQGEERAEDGETKEVEKEVKEENDVEDDEDEDDDADGEMDAAAAAGTGEKRRDGGVETETTTEELSFPDTTIPLSHLQPSR